MEFCSARQPHSFSQQDVLAQRKNERERSISFIQQSLSQTKPAHLNFILVFLGKKEAHVKKHILVNDAVYMFLLHTDRPIRVAHLFVIALIFMPVLGECLCSWSR